MGDQPHAAGDRTGTAGQSRQDDDDGRARWQRRYDSSRVREADFTTLSGLTVDPVYGPPEGSVVPGFDRIGWPGEFPFTRGLYPAGYRGLQLALFQGQLGLANVDGA